MEKIIWRYVLIGWAIAASALSVGEAAESKQPAADPVGRIDVVASFDVPLPTGVIVSPRGRIHLTNYGDNAILRRDEGGSYASLGASSAGIAGSDCGVVCLVS